MGTSSIVYVSIPDTTTTCANLGLPTLPTGWNYNCVTATSTKLSNGNGWVPVNFNQITFGSPLSNLPIDPQNTTTTNYYTYVSGGSWQIAAKLGSQKYQPQAAFTNDYDPGLYVVGSNTNLAPFVGGLVGWWKFDDNNNSTTTDSSGYGNTGTWNGTSTSRYVAGKVGAYAGSFNGDDDYVNIGDVPSVNVGANPFSVSFWMNGSGNLGGKCGQAWSSIGWQMLYSYGSLLFYVNKGGENNPNTLRATFSSSAWHHIVATRSGTTASIYVDGNLAKSESNPLHDGNLANSDSQNIGRVYGWGNFLGQIDDYRIYSRALSSSEILAIYNATR